MEKTVLGESKCLECGGVKVLVVTQDEYEKQGLIMSRCLKCGFTEHEWRFGDGHEYLEELAKIYGVKVEELKEAVKKYSHVPTYIQKAIIGQLQTLNPFFETLYNVKAVIAREDGRTVRLHTKQPNGKIINIDITYHYVPDLYSLTLYEVKGGQAKVLEKTEPEIYAQELDETIHELLNKHANTSPNIVRRSRLV